MLPPVKLDTLLIQLPAAANYIICCSCHVAVQTGNVIWSKYNEKALQDQIKKAKNLTLSEFTVFNVEITVLLPFSHVCPFFFNKYKLLENIILFFVSSSF